MMLAQFYLPTIGGEEQLVRSLSHGLANRGHDVSVVTLWHHGLPTEEQEGPVHIHRIKGTSQRARSLFSESRRRHAPPFPDPELTLALRRLIAHQRPHIVHAHNWLVHSFLPLKSWSGARLVLSLHDYSTVCVKKNLVHHAALCDGPAPLKCLACAAHHYGPLKGGATLLGNWSMSFLQRRAVDMYLPVSEATARGNGLPGSGLPFQIMPNIVPGDCELSEPDAAIYLDRLPDGDFFLFVGDLRDPKGVTVLLRAYAALPDAPPLVLIGRQFPDSPQHLPPNVSILGSWPHYAVMQAWQRCMVGLVPSLWHEPFGLVALEAMASGRPVIASRIGGLPDVVVDGETGLLVPPGDAVALGQAMARLAGDEKLRRRMGNAARRHVESFRADMIVPRVERVYQDLLQTKPTGALAEDAMPALAIEER